MWQTWLACLGGSLAVIGIVITLLLSATRQRSGWKLDPITPRTIRRLRARISPLKMILRNDVCALVGHAGYLVGLAATKVDRERPEQALPRANLALAVIELVEYIVELQAEWAARARKVSTDPVLRGELVRALDFGLDCVRIGDTARAFSEFSDVWLDRAPEKARSVALAGAIVLLADAGLGRTHAELVSAASEQLREAASGG